jgi:hypothetical protein
LKEQSLLMSVPPNLVQSIRAFRVAELQEEAARLGSTFVCALHRRPDQTASTGHYFGVLPFPKGVGKNFDGLRETLTETMFKAGTRTVSCGAGAIAQYPEI